MTTPQQEIKTTQVTAYDIERAAQLAQVMTADPDATRGDDRPWTVHDVLGIALSHGLDALEQRYPKTS